MNGDIRILALRSGLVLRPPEIHRVFGDESPVTIEDDRLQFLVLQAAQFQPHDMAGFICNFTDCLVVRPSVRVIGSGTAELQRREANDCQSNVP